MHSFFSDLKLQAVSHAALQFRNAVGIPKVGIMAIGFRIGTRRQHAFTCHCSRTPNGYPWQNHSENTPACCICNSSYHTSYKINEHAYLYGPGHTKCLMCEPPQKSSPWSEIAKKRSKPDCCDVTQAHHFFLHTLPSWWFEFSSSQQRG